MDIIIRDIDKMTIASLDDLARKSRKSRNQYIKEQLELIALAPQLRQQEDRYLTVIRELAEIIKANTDVFNNL